MAAQALICIIEDENDLAQLVDDYLSNSDFRTIQFHNGLEADSWLENNQADLILLDLMLPGMDGLQLCRQQQNRNRTPIIMMTAKVEEIDRLLGLELGADDYICKPFSPREVVARVKAVLRRCQSAPESTNTPENIHIDEEKQIVNVLGRTIDLTAIEFKLFSLLYSQPGRVFSRQYILDNLYQDYRVVGDRTVDSHIKKLRKKLRPNEADPELIRSVYGSGYKFEQP